MTNFIKYVACTALAYEGWSTLFNVMNMVDFAKTMELGVPYVLGLFVYITKLVCFFLLAYGVITNNGLSIRIWLLVSYALIDWTSIGKCFARFYEYFVTDKYSDKSEFILEIKEAFGPLMGQVMEKIGIILIIYRYYKFLQPPEKIRGPLTATKSRYIYENK